MGKPSNRENELRQKIKSLQDKVATQDKAWRAKLDAADKQLQTHMRVAKHGQTQLQVRNSVIVHVLRGLEGLCTLMRNALLHRTCPACNAYPCDGTHAQCNLEMYAAHRGKTVEQVAREGQRVVQQNTQDVPLAKEPAPPGQQGG